MARNIHSNPKSGSRLPRPPKGAGVRKTPAVGSKRYAAAKSAKRPVPHPLERLGYLTLELVFLAIAGLVATISVLGHAAHWFGGIGLTQSLLPFSGTVLGLAIAGSLFLWLWGHIHQRLVAGGPKRPALVAFLVFMAALVFAMRPSFKDDLASLKSLVGGTEQAGRVTIAHQVYANYRRSELDGVLVMLERSRPYLEEIRKASKAFDVNGEILVGIAMAESSFLPRDSQDGGRGLFQITAIPAVISSKVARQLHVPKPDPNRPEDAAYLAAATFDHYLRQMHGDLFLGLLAYNIGPRNGGLRSIMEQYGAKDFSTIQPYLKLLPRDYPIRVLTGALAFRLWGHYGTLPRYEDGENARTIQALGIPGLDI